jgi:nitroimidazol reductase NimA-like FMN-containing flavoprotein (pyridoxamine 5'-phosphate oxidase superfamily)
VKEKKQAILQLLDRHRVMAFATNRPDGWPQVTLVGYVNDGFLLYCFVAHNSQKHANIRRDSRVSVAIGSDAPSLSLSKDFRSRERRLLSPTRASSTI